MNLTLFYPDFILSLRVHIEMESSKKNIKVSIMDKKYRGLKEKSAYSSGLISKG